MVVALDGWARSELIDSGEPPSQNLPHSLRIGTTSGNFFLRSWSSYQEVDHQVCAASFHEVLVASGIVGVCKIQVPEETLSDTPSLGMYSEPVDVLVQFQLVGILILGLSRNAS